MAADIAGRLGDSYTVWSKGYSYDREKTIGGRYIDKQVDICICRKDMPLAGIAVKFVMQNYSQNSNNYFENMLGETANIRCKGYPYFHIFIILDKLPYYDRYKNIKGWETFSDHNISKYAVLSSDDARAFYHTPDKTLLYVVHLPEPECELNTAQEYLDYYRTGNHTLSLTEHNYEEFAGNVILNDYDTFIDKVYHTVKAL